jgi:hypothetical protein
MFNRKLLILKFLITLLGAYFIFTSIDTSNIDKVFHGYTFKQSYFPGDTAKIFLQPLNNYRKIKFKLRDLSGNEVGSIVSSVFVQDTNIINAYREGFGYEASFNYIIPKGLKSGLYLWENKIPLLIKSAEEAEIAVVYPFNTINLYSNSGGKSFYTYNSTDGLPSDTLSFHRPFSGIDQFIKPFLNWIWKQDKWSVKYLSDIDLNNPKNLEKIKILIIAGYSNTWSRKARENYDSFINNGGNSIILSANTMYWKTRYNEDLSHMITFKKCEDDPEQDQACKWNDKNETMQKSILTNYDLGGAPLNDGFSFSGLKIYSENSPVLKNTDLKNGDTIKILNQLVDGLMMNFENDEPQVTDPYFLNFYKKELIAYDRLQNGNGAFVVFQRNKDSGIIFNTSSLNWCSDKGIGGKDSVRIQLITTNMIELLLKNKNVFSN